MTDRQFRLVNRLSGQKAYRQVFSSKRRSSNRSLLLIARNNGIGIPRLGLVVPKRYIQKAVQRNYIKRLFRESFRLNKGNLTGLDIVIVVKRNIVSWPNLRSVLNKHWSNLCK